MMEYALPMSPCASVVKLSDVVAVPGTTLVGHVLEIEEGGANRPLRAPHSLSLPYSSSAGRPSKLLT